MHYFFFFLVTLSFPLWRIPDLRDVLVHQTLSAVRTKGHTKNKQHLLTAGKNTHALAHTTRAQTGTAWVLNFEKPVRNFTVCLQSKWIPFSFFFSTHLSPSAPWKNKQTTILILQDFQLQLASSRMAEAESEKPEDSNSSLASRKSGTKMKPGNTRYMYVHLENTRYGQPNQHFKEQMDHLLSTQD